MAKKVVITLTVEQAEALRTMCNSSDQYNSDDGLDFTPAMRRAVKKLEDALERTKNAHYTYRMTPRD